MYLVFNLTLEIKFCKSDLKNLFLPVGALSCISKHCVFVDILPLLGINGCVPPPLFCSLLLSLMDFRDHYLSVYKAHPHSFQAACCSPVRNCNLSGSHYWWAVNGNLLPLQTWRATTLSKHWNQTLGFPCLLNLGFSSICKTHYLL